MTATDGALRQRLLGVVAGAVAAFGVLLAGAVGAIAGAPAWAWTFVGRRPVVTHADHHLSSRDRPVAAVSSGLLPPPAFDV